MGSALADILAEIDDADTIESVLQEVEQGSEFDALQQRFSPTSQPTLTEYYNRYETRRSDRSPATISNYKRTIPKFTAFAADHNVTYPAELTTDLVDDYVDSLQKQYGADATIALHTSNIRAWLRWLHKRKSFDERVYRLLDKDELGLSPKARDEAFPKREAAAVLGTLREQRYGSHVHALLEFLWNAGLRIGEVRALDITDVDLTNNDLLVRHRPDEGTRIKNGDGDDTTNGDGERDIMLHPRVCNALATYIQLNRHEVSDEAGRDPLFTTTRGRPARSTLRRWVYEATSCRWTDPELAGQTCDGSCDPDSDVCSCSYYPHAIRRGAIVNHLSNNLRPDKAAERFDVSPDVIRKHYDPRSKARRKNDRSEAVKNAWEDL